MSRQFSGFVLGSLVCVLLVSLCVQANETVSVSVYVWNGSNSGVQRLVLDTETLILTEYDESGTFRSGVSTSSALTVEIEPREDAYFYGEDLYRDNISYYSARAWDKFFDKYVVRISPFTHILDRNYPDGSEVPKMAQFGEVNMFMVLIVLGGILATFIMWFVYRSWYDDHAADEMEHLSEERILESPWYVLLKFSKRHPNHPSAKKICMELGRQLYNNMDYRKASEFFQQAIKMDAPAKNPEAHFYLGHCLLHMDYFCDAIDEWVACYMDDPSGPFAQESWLEAQRWRARQIVHDTESCPKCGADCRLIDMTCRECGTKLKRTLIHCGVCGKTMIKEAQVCIHCLPDDVKAEVAAGSWPILKTTVLDWEAELIKSRLVTADIPCVLTGEKGSAIPVQVGHLGEIHIRVPISHLAEAQGLVFQSG